MIIDPTSPIVGESSNTFWQDELTNSKILLNKLNVAIQALTTGGHQNYSLDSGQSVQKVTRLDLDMLRNWRSDLISDIRDLELKLGVGTPGVFISVPGW